MHFNSASAVHTQETATPLAFNNHNAYVPVDQILLAQPPPTSTPSHPYPMSIQAPYWNSALPPTHHHTHGAYSGPAPVIPSNPAPLLQPSITLTPVPSPPVYGAFDVSFASSFTRQSSPSAWSAPPGLPRHLVGGEANQSFSGSRHANRRTPPASTAGSHHGSHQVRRTRTTPTLGATISVTIHPDVLSEAKELYILRCTVEGDFFPTMKRKPIIAQECILQSRTRFTQRTGAILSFSISDLNETTLGSVH
jgi:hypothetical protein